MRSSVALVALAATAVSAAVQNYTSSLNMTITPSSVDASTRASWCQAQTNTCTLLCDDSTDKNTCLQSDLSYSCLCSSNHSAPGLQYYTQTLPTFICQELYSECISANTGSSSGQQECTTKIQNLCGTLSPPNGTSSSTTTTAAASASATSSGSGTSATGSSVTTTSSNGLAAPTLAPVGQGAVAAVALGMLAYLI